MKNIIAAYAQNRLIGATGHLPWRGNLPADMQRFRELTTGHSVIMGRATYESIGRPLPRRRNIVLSQQTNLKLPGCEVVNSYEDALSLVKKDEEIFIIGGAKIYALALPSADHLYITEIQAEFVGDSFFLDIDPAEWRIMADEQYQADDRNLYNYRFVTYERT